jgi:hypothetical protein
MKRMRKGRPTKYDEKLVAYTLNLRSDQVAYLRKLQNASQWLRDLIDERIAAETASVATTDTILMAKQVTAIKFQIKQLTQAQEYVKAKKLSEFIDNLTDFRDSNTELTFRFDAEGAYLYTGAILWQFTEYVPGWTREALEALLREHNVNLTKGEFIAVPVDAASIILDRMIKACIVEQAILAEFKKRIAELTKRVDDLNQRIMANN